MEETATANAYFLPETLNVSGNVETQKLHRGIYDAVVVPGADRSFRKICATRFWAA